MICDNIYNITNVAKIIARNRTPSNKFSVTKVQGLTDSYSTAKPSHNIPCETSAEDTEEYLGLLGLEDDDDKSLEELQEFLKTLGNYFITQFGRIVWIQCSTAKDKKKILKTWGKMKMICGLPVFIQSFNEKEYQDYFFEYMALKKSSGGCLSSLIPKISLFNLK